MVRMRSPVRSRLEAPTQAGGIIGNTSDSDSEVQGSSPCRPANHAELVYRIESPATNRGRQVRLLYSVPILSCGEAVSHLTLTQRSQVRPLPRQPICGCGVTGITTDC